MASGWPDVSIAKDRLTESSTLCRQTMLYDAVLYRINGAWVK